MATPLSRIVSDFETSLSGAVSVGNSSFIIQSVTDDDGNTLENGTYCFTLDRDNTGAKEYLVGQLDNATKTISGVSSVSRQGVLTANIQRPHRIGTNVIISDHSALNAIVKILNGTGTLDAGNPIQYDGTATISGANMLATKSYVDSVVNGGSVTYDAQILSGQTAGETVAEGNIVYRKTSDSYWWKADGDDTATFKDVQLGVALGAGTAGNPISGGVQVSGTCGAFTGLTANTAYYLSGTAGAVSTSAGTYSVLLGTATSTTDISFNPQTISIPTVNFALPIGTILPYGASSAPSGFLACDGSAVSRTTYAGLFSVLSTNYGAGDGSTTFNVPNLLGRFPLGYSASAPTKVFTFASRSSNTITVTGSSNTNNNEIQTGQAVLYTAASGAMTGLTHNTTYYLIRVAYNQFSLATSVANANAGTVISLSSDGTGTQTFTATYSARAIGVTGGEETHALTDAEMPSHNKHAAFDNAGSNFASGASDGITNETAGSDVVHNNMPLFTVVNYIIKH
jgi:microcystin-dependent protein